MQFEVVIEKDETGAFIADVPVLPGCHTFGASKREALANIREAIELYLEARGTPRTQLVSKIALKNAEAERWCSSPSSFDEWSFRFQEVE